jgi:hypothetical protein
MVGKDARRLEDVISRCDPQSAALPAAVADGIAVTSGPT